MNEVIALLCKWWLCCAALWFLGAIYFEVLEIRKLLAKAAQAGKKCSKPCFDVTDGHGTCSDCPHN